MLPNGSSTYIATRANHANRDANEYLPQFKVRGNALKLREYCTLFAQFRGAERVNVIRIQSASVRRGHSYAVPYVRGTLLHILVFNRLTLDLAPALRHVPKMFIFRHLVLLSLSIFGSRAIMVAGTAIVTFLREPRPRVAATTSASRTQVRHPRNPPDTNAGVPREATKIR